MAEELRRAVAEAIAAALDERARAGDKTEAVVRIPALHTEATVAIGARALTGSGRRLRRTVDVLDVRHKKPVAHATYVFYDVLEEWASARDAAVYVWHAPTRGLRGMLVIRGYRQPPIHLARGVGHDGDWFKLPRRRVAGS